VTDYFFISSPLHFLIAANISIQNPQNRATAVIISRAKKTATRYRIAAERNPKVFNRTITLTDGVDKRSNMRSALYKRLKAEFSQPMKCRIFTGNDRRIEFQYAIYTATKTNRHVEGIYMDEGAVTYVGHKSLHRFGHRYIDPLFRKLFYGFWCKNAITTGTSPWVSSAYVAFPDLVHPLLQHKHLVAIDPAPFKSQTFKDIASAMLDQNSDYGSLLSGIRLVMTLPHEGSYIAHPEMYQAISSHLLTHFQPSEIAIKAHPRITNHEILQQMFPGTTILDNTIGMEVLLALLDDRCIVAGDISSTLLTTKWIRPNLPVVALIAGASPSGTLIQLYTALNIPMVRNDQLAQWLASQSQEDNHNPIGPNPTL
jgi:hypothetical protein